MKKTKARSISSMRKQGWSENGFLSDMVNSKEGVVSPQIFTNPEINRLEMERIYTRSWLYVAHESEIPHAGDFVTRYMGGDPVIVWRGQDGKVRVFLNVCRHRGITVCGEDMGKAAHMICPYHGWIYSNSGELISVPFYEGFQGRLDKGSLGLYEAPKIGSYHGLIFANWEAGAESLSDYLGEMKWVLDLLFGRTAGVEVVGAPMRWEADANWKLAAANFAGDGVHVSTTHGYRSAIGLQSLLKGERVSYRLTTESGHASALAGFKGKYSMGLPEELRSEMEHRLTKEQLKAMEPLVVVVGNVFPNLSFLNSGQHVPEEWGGPKDRLISFLTLRQWQPKGADKMEVWSWCFVDKNAPEWWKEASRECYLRAFGVAGMFEQDDMENWAEINQSLRGPIAKRLWLQYKMGLGRSHKETPIPTLKNMHDGSLSEDSERAFYRYWQKLMMQPKEGSDERKRKKH